MQQFEKFEKKEDKPQNRVNISGKSRIDNVVKYVNGLFKSGDFDTVYITAVGNAITNLLTIVEILKIVNPGLHQINIIDTLIAQTVDVSRNEVVDEKRYPKMDITLTQVEPLEKGFGYQEALTEEQRKEFASIFIFCFYFWVISAFAFWLLLLGLKF